MLRDSWLAKTQQAVLRSGGRRPPMPRHSRPMPRRAEGSSIRVIADILSSCQAA